MSLLRYFHPVLPSTELKQIPVGTQVGDEKLVLFRSTDGKAAAVRDQCPHRFTPLSAGYVNQAGRITCPYHGWNFNDKGEGVKPGSDRIACRVLSYQVVERHGFIWVGDNRADSSKIPQFNEEGWAFLDSYRCEFAAPLHVALDNFSEDEHFPFVHKVFGWDEQGVNQVEHQCTRVGDEVHVSYWGPQRSFTGMTWLGVKPGQFLENRWVQSYDPVNINYRTRLTDKDKNVTSPGSTWLSIYFVPSGEKTYLQCFQLVKFQSKFWYKILPLIRGSYLKMVKNDIEYDRQLTNKLRDIPYSLRGMALGKYDEPLKHNRELLEKVYFGVQRTPAELARLNV